MQVAHGFVFGYYIRLKFLMNQYQKRCVKGLSFLVKNLNDENVFLSLNFMRLYLFGEIFFIQRTSIFAENVKLVCIE